MGMHWQHRAAYHDAGRPMLGYLCSGWYIVVLHVYILSWRGFTEPQYVGPSDTRAKKRAVIWKSILRTVRVHFCSRARKQTAPPASSPCTLKDRRAQLCNDRPSKPIINCDVLCLEHDPFASGILVNFLDCTCSLWQAQQARIDQFSTRSLQDTIHWLHLPPNPPQIRRRTGILITYHHRSFGGP
jgi:hypothetical protein